VRVGVCKGIDTQKALKLRLSSLSAFWTHCLGMAIAHGEGRLVCVCVCISALLCVYICLVINSHIDQYSETVCGQLLGLLEGNAKTFLNHNTRKHA